MRSIGRQIGAKLGVVVGKHRQGIPLDRVLAGASRHDSPLLAGTLDKLGNLGPLPGDIRVHLDAGYDSQVTRDELAARKMTGQIAHKGEKGPIQAGQRWPVERANAWHSAFNSLQCCYERRENVIDAYFDLALTDYFRSAANIYGPLTPPGVASGLCCRLRLGPCRAVRNPGPAAPRAGGAPDTLCPAGELPCAVNRCRRAGAAATDVATAAVSTAALGHPGAARQPVPGLTGSRQQNRSHA